MKATHTRARGFTLLEMVVAIAIFAIIAAISYSGLNNFLDARAHINGENERVRALQTMFVLLEQDLRYAVNRSVRNEYGDVEPAFVGDADQPLAEGERLRLTTVRPAPAGAGAHQVTRVAWRLNDGDLYRVAWRVVDRDIDSTAYPRRMMSEVEDVALQFYHREGNDGELEAGRRWQAGGRLPAGVAVTVIPADGNAYQRLFEVAGGRP